jgi:PAS domain S-box-containing protein
MMDFSGVQNGGNQTQATLGNLARTLDAVLDPAYLLDQEANLLYVNPAACKAHGWDMHTLLAKKVYEFDAILDSNSWNDAWRRAIELGEARFETVHLDAANRQYPVEITASPYQHENELMVLAISRDISARRQAEAALLREQQRAQQYLDIAEVSMVALDRSGLITMINPKACKVLGYSESALLGENWFNRIIPDDARDQAKKMFHSLMAGEGVNFQFVESMVVTSRGDRRQMQWHNSLLKDATGKIDGLLSSGTDVTDAHANRQRIIDSEMQLNAIFSNSQVGIMLLTGYRNLARCNQRMADIAGFESPEQMLGINMRQLHISEKNFQDFGERYYENLREQKVLHVEYPLLRHDGRVVWCLLSGKALDPATPPDLSKGVIWVVDDIDHIKQTERELREQRDLFSGGPTMVFQWRPQEGWPVEFCSANVSNILGYEIEQLISGEIPFASLIHPDDLPRIGGEVTHYLESGTDVFEQDYRLRHVDGHYLYFYDFTRVQRDDNGRERMIYGYLLDITERKLAELELLESSQRYTDVVNSTLDGFWVVDLNGIIHEVNEAYCLQSGYAREEIVNHHVSGFDEIDDPAKVQDRIAMIRQQGSMIFETNHRRKDGSTWPVEVAVSFSQVQEGRFFAFIRDLSDRIEAEKERLRLEREVQQSHKMEALGQLSGGVAHEFNNMLAIIHGHLGLLSAEISKTADPKLTTYVENIKQAGQRAMELTRQMLTFSRPGERKPEIIDLESSVADAISMSKASLPSSIRINFNVEPSLPVICLDVLELQQIMTNLLINARDAMDGKGEVSVDVVSYTGQKDYCTFCHSVISGQWIEIRVSDTGHGISRENLSRLFEPFFTTKAVGKGTGLGLAVVQAILERNRGHILVDSEPGKGTSLRLLFPPAVATVSKPEPVPQQVKSEKSFAGRILVVDDEPLITLYLTEMLSPSGHEVTATNNSMEALKLLESHDCQFDILITDQTMPVMFGTELVQQAKRLCPGLKCILCTGHSEIVDRFSAPEFGIDYFLEKPTDPDELDSCIQRILEESGRSEAQPQ